MHDSFYFYDRLFQVFQICILRIWNIQQRKSTVRYVDTIVPNLGKIVLMIYISSIVYFDW